MTKHWHRCERWSDKRLGCPFREEDEDENDQVRTSPDLKFTTSAAAAASVVRDRARGKRPLKEMEASAARVPVGQFPREPMDMVATAVEEEVLKIAGIGVPPVPWVPGPGEAEILRRLGIPRETVYAFRETTGSASLQANLPMAMAEEAVTSAVSASAGRDPWAVIVLPMVMEALRRFLVKQPAGFDRVQQPGSAFRPSTEAELKHNRPVQRPMPYRVSRMMPPRVHPDLMRQPVPVRRGGGGGFHFNAAERMREMIGVSRRRVTPFRQSDPSL